MAQIFLSYDRDDAARAKAIAAALEGAGHNVWWDRHIRGGAQYSKEIEQALKDADAVVVLWSECSVESPWVRDEAALARDSGRLVPVALDRTEPPMGFRQYQTIDLSRWNGRRGARQVQELLRSVGAFDGSLPTARPPEVATRPSFRLGRNAILAGLGGLALAAGAAALLLWRPWAGDSTATVAIRAADTSPVARELARDLLVQLGNARSPGADAELVGETANVAPDLILEVSGSLSGPRPSANLLLLRGKDRQLLASQDLAIPEGETADLRTSIAVAAAGAVDCATEALVSRPMLRLDLLKQFMGACTRFASLYGMEDVSLLIPQLEQVVERDPGFLPARAQLLLAGAFMRSIPTEVAKPSPHWIRVQVEAARRIDPALPELRIAELELLPWRDFARRLSLADSVHKAHPDNLYVLGARAELLMVIGRNNDAVVDAERAARMNPLAPYARSEYVRALAFSGRTTRALEELNNFRPISPVGMNLTDARFRVNMRYGDPRPALRILRMYGTSKAHEAFLTARIEPTNAHIARATALGRSVAEERGFYSSAAEVLEAFGQHEEAYQMLMGMPDEHVDQWLLQTLFRPTLKRLRENPRFLRLAQRFGLLHYWRTSGKWPDFCFDPDLPYDCKAEAAKLMGREA